MSKLIPYALYLYLVALHVVILEETTAIFSIAFNLPVLLVMIIALYKSETAAAWFGFGVGLVLGAAVPSTMGWHALALAAIAFAAFNLRERLNIESVYARLLIVVTGTLLHNLLTVGLYQTEGLFALFFTAGLGGTVYTAVIGWAVLGVKEGSLTWARIKSIF
ncbi:MAG: rod shape-determining protein MreD [Candidatus Zixiibacteriota bacterium]